jgi:hypothetical protein
MTLAEANDLQQHLMDETRRLSMSLDDAAAAPPRDGEFLLHSLITSVLDDPRRFKQLSAVDRGLGLTDSQLTRVAEALGRSGRQLNRFDFATAPDQVLQSATGLSRAELLRLRLQAAGLPTKHAATPSARPTDTSKASPSQTGKTPRDRRSRRD